MYLSAVHGQTARDADRLAGHESGIVAGEVRDQARVIGGLPDAAERHAANHGIANLLTLLAAADERVHRGRVGWTRTDAVEQNVVPRHFTRQGLGEGNRRTLAA